MRQIIILLFLSHFLSLGVNAQYNFLKVDSLLFNENYSAAIPLLDNLISEDSLNSLAFYKLGIAYQESYRNDKALKCFSKALYLDSLNFDYKLSLAKCFYNTGILTEAKKLLEDICIQDSSNLPAKVILAKIYSEKSEYKKAFNIYTKIAEADTSNPFLIKQLGYCLMKMDSLKPALKYYGKAFELNNNDANAAVQISIISLALDRLDSAIQYVDIGLEIYPEESGFNSLKGDIIFRMKDYSKAINYYLKAIAAGDSSGSMYFKLGYCYYQVAANPDSTVIDIKSFTENFKNFGYAFNAFQKSYQLDKQNAFNCYYAGLCADKLTKTDTAIFYFEESLNNSFPTFAPVAYKLLGNNYQLRERYNETVEAYKKAYLSDPNDKDLLHYIGMVYRNFINDEESADKYFKMFLDEKKGSNDGLVTFTKQLISNKQKKK